jgi:hypothetical protein
MMENKSNSIIQLEPNFDKPDYFVVGKSPAMDGANRCLKYNANETCLFVNTGKKIRVYEIGIGPNSNKGIRKTRISIPIKNKNPNVVIEDFVALLNKGVITCDSYGLVEVFFFDIKNEKFKKLSEFNLNEGVKSKAIFEQVTTMAMNDKGTKLALATVNNPSPNELGCLSRLLILNLTQ